MQIEYNANNFKLPPGSTNIHTFSYSPKYCPCRNDVSLIYLSLNFVSGISYPRDILSPERCVPERCVHIP
jgi:hypothetical protein